MKHMSFLAAVAAACLVCGSVALAAPKIETMQQLQAHTDELIKIAQNDMRAWTKPQASSKSAAKSAAKSATKASKRPPRATRTIPVSKPKANPKSKSRNVHG